MVVSISLCSAFLGAADRVSVVPTPQMYEQYQQGVNYCMGVNGAQQSFRRALELLLPLADLFIEVGHLQIAGVLGYIYAFGDAEVPCNLEEARNWFKYALPLQHPLIFYFLGCIHYCGDAKHGIEKDYTRADFFWRKAAECGHERACYFLGEIYRTGGYGVSQDVSQTLLWWIRATRYGLDGAYENLCDFMKEMWPVVRLFQLIALLKSVG